MFVQTLGVIFAYYMILFIIGQIKKNNSIVDTVWGLGFVIAAWFTFFSRESSDPQSLAVTVMVSIWGLRLTYYITKRNWGKPEDFRYVNFRKKWGESFKLLKAFLHVYMLQMAMLILISLSFINTNLRSDGEFNVLLIVGVLVWIVGFLFESIADYQLATFKKDPSNKGKILTSGLHKYTRHPNYFGEATLWWGVFIVGLSTSGGLLTIISPITITVLVRFVSGVPMLEKHYKDREAYQVYAKTTPIFIPKFTRRSK
jgi:steroid 5-alpha reductase family enzyme